MRESSSLVGSSRKATNMLGKKTVFFVGDRGSQPVLIEVPQVSKKAKKGPNRSALLSRTKKLTSRRISTKSFQMLSHSGVKNASQKSVRNRKPVSRTGVAGVPSWEETCACGLPIRQESPLRVTAGSKPLLILENLPLQQSFHSRPFTNSAE